MTETPASLEDYLQATESRVRVYMRGPSVLDKKGKQQLGRELAAEIDVYCQLIYEGAQSCQSRDRHAAQGNWTAWNDACHRVIRARVSTAAAIMPEVDRVLNRWLKKLVNKEYQWRDKARLYKDAQNEQSTD